MTEKQKKVKDWKYIYGFNDDVDCIFRTPKGLNADIVRKISAHKKESA